MNNVFVVSKDKKFFDTVPQHSNAIHIKQKSLNKKALQSIIKQDPTEHFFVIQDNYELPMLDYFPFDYECEDDAVHRWNKKEGVMLFPAQKWKLN